MKRILFSSYFFFCFVCFVYLPSISSSTRQIVDYPMIDEILDFQLGELSFRPKSKVLNALIQHNTQAKQQKTRQRKTRHDNIRQGRD